MKQKEEEAKRQKEKEGQLEENGKSVK